MGWKWTSILELACFRSWNVCRQTPLEKKASFCNRLGKAALFSFCSWIYLKRATDTLLSDKNVYMIWAFIATNLMSGSWEVIKVQSGSHKTIHKCYTESCQPTLDMFCSFLLVSLLLWDNLEKANLWHLVCFVEINFYYQFWYSFFRETM